MTETQKTCEIKEAGIDGFEFQALSKILNQSISDKTAKNDKRLEN